MRRSKAGRPTAAKSRTFNNYIGNLRSRGLVRFAAAGVVPEESLVRVVSEAKSELPAEFAKGDRLRWTAPNGEERTGAVLPQASWHI